MMRVVHLFVAVVLLAAAAPAWALGSAPGGGLLGRTLDSPAAPAFATTGGEGVLSERLTLSGGGQEADVTPVVALILGIFPGFGLGHLIAGDQGGFTFWLVVDLALVAAWIIVGAAASPSGVFHGLASLAVLVLHVIQGFDAFEAAGGDSPFSTNVDPALEPAWAGRAGPRPVATATLSTVRF